MTFIALLTKELRLRMRQERTIWVIIVYILLMGLIGWFFISRFSSTSSYGYIGNGLSDVGKQLYFLLSQLQLFLIMFITPAFTSTAVNGEKERQTYDMLLCSRLSAFSLVAGKLMAGLVNAFLLIAAAIPLFSLVFFFGGVSPQQILEGLVVYIMTTLTIGTIGLFFSTLLKRPAISTACVYMIGLLWLLIPILSLFILSAYTRNGVAPQPNFYIWNPAVVLASTYSNALGLNLPPYTLNGVRISYTIAYTILCLIASNIFFFLSVWTVKPNGLVRLRSSLQRKKMENTIGAA